MKKAYWVVVLLACAGLMIGTFADVSVSQAMFAPGSHFGEFFAVAGMGPVFVMVPLAPGLLLGALIRQFKRLSAPGRVFCVALECAGAFVAYSSTSGFVGSRHLHGLPFEWLVVIVVGAFLLCAALGWHASKKYPDQVLSAAIIGVVSVCGSRYIVNNIKDMWGRQRFWTMDDVPAQFTPWYLPQFPGKERLAEMGDKIKSFPSGHSAGAMSVLWLSLFPSFIGLCKRRETAYFGGITTVALCFWALTIVSRVVLGEHFLSDVCMSAILFLALFVTMSLLAPRLVAAITPASAQADR